MKKILLVSLVFFHHSIFAQEIVNRSDEGNTISLLSSSVPLRLAEPYCFVRAGAIITKDTIIPNIYLFSFYYNTPQEILLDTTSEIEIRFSDGALFSFNNINNSKNITLKDSMVSFKSILSYNCLQKIIHVPISTITFITPLYTHQIEMEDKMKLFFPNLVKFILDKSDEEFEPILKEARSWNAPPIVFNPMGNQQLDKKYYGKYSGEWNREGIVATFKLYIKSDTSYIVWHFLKNPYENKDVMQVLNIRGVDENSSLVMDVCFDEKDPDHTNGRRTYYLKLAENGKVVYGSSIAFNNLEGHLYGVRKKKFRK